jgi:hypothetical protein
MGPTGLRAADTEHPVFPVQIVQSQAADFPGPQPIGNEQHQDRPVALVDRTILLNGSQQTQNILAPKSLEHRLIGHEPGRHNPRSQPRPAPAARFGKQEERPQTLSVVVYRPAVPGSPLVLCRNDIVDVIHPDGAQGNTLSSQPEEEVVGGAAVVLYGRRGKAALLAQPLLKDRDLCVMRMVLMFEFVEPPQEAQPLDSATDKACSRLG